MQNLPSNPPASSTTTPIVAAVKPLSSTGRRIGVAVLGVLAGLLLAMAAQGALQANSAFLPVFANRSIDNFYRYYSSVTLVASFLTILLSPLFGLAADLLGRRTFIVIGTILLALGLGVSAFATRLALLWLAEILIALGSACLVPALLAFLVSAFSTRRLACSAAGLYTGLGILAGSFATTLMGASINMTGLNRPLLGPGVLLGVLAIPAALLLAGSFFLSRSHTWPVEWLEGPVRKFGVFEILMLLPLAVMIAFALAYVTNYFIFIVNASGNIQPSRVGVFFGLVALATGLGCLLSGPLADGLDWLAQRFARRSIGYAAFILLGSLLLLLGSLLVSQTGQPAFINLAAVALGIGHGLLLPAWYALFFSAFRSRWWATAAGLAAALITLGFILGPILAGPAESSATPGQFVLWPALAAGAFALLLSTVLLIERGATR